LIHCLKHSAGGAEEFKVARLGVTRDFVQPPYRFRLQTRFRRTIRRVNQFDFHFNGILAALYPPFSSFASFVHCDP
jgi:hypothetical protein